MGLRDKGNGEEDEEGRNEKVAGLMYSGGKMGNRCEEGMVWLSAGSAENAHSTSLVQAVV